jgi:sensor c-di-GMP phosphodiesterase-like protein
MGIKNIEKTWKILFDFVISQQVPSFGSFFSQMDENSVPTNVDAATLAKAAMIARNNKKGGGKTKSSAQIAAEKEAALKTAAKKKEKKAKQNEKQGGLSKMDAGFSH